MYQKEIAGEDKGKVSIIIPVYNAEQYLGQTLSSVIRQTYRNIEILLINDGSTDSSLRICRNYEQLDKRVRIINIENQGVSHARNKGIQEATGDYIQFVDSDDTISTHMTERLVETMISYNADLVISGVRSVQMENGKMVCYEDWTPAYLGKECILSKKEFDSDFSAILLYTVLMESSWNKLFKRKYIEQYKLCFPEDKSLGEDFIFNLSYFRKISNVVFISDILYFYMQQNSQSLTKRYRDDLFDNEMSMLAEYKNYLVSEKVWTGNNVKLFYQYAVGHIIKCLEELSNFVEVFGKSNTKAKLYKILSTKETRKWIDRAGWIPENYVWLKGCIKHNDIGFAYEKILEIHQQNIRIKTEQSEQINVRYYPGKLNKCVDGFLKKINLVFKSKRIDSLMESVENKGLKNTIVNLVLSCKRRLSKLFAVKKDT